MKCKVVALISAILPLCFASGAALANRAEKTVLIDSSGTEIDLTEALDIDLKVNLLTLNPSYFEISGKFEIPTGQDTAIDCVLNAKSSNERPAAEGGKIYYLDTSCGYTPHSRVRVHGYFSVKHTSDPASCWVSGRLDLTQMALESGRAVRDLGKIRYNFHGFPDKF